MLVWRACVLSRSVRVNGKGHFMESVLSFLLCVTSGDLSQVTGLVQRACAPAEPSPWFQLRFVWEPSELCISTAMVFLCKGLLLGFVFHRILFASLFPQMLYVTHTQINRRKLGFGKKNIDRGDIKVTKWRKLFQWAKTDPVTKYSQTLVKLQTEKPQVVVSPLLVLLVA